MAKTSSIFSKKKKIEEETHEKEVVSQEMDEISPTDEKTNSTKKRKFVIVTEDFTGLGWAKKLQHEGNDVILAYKLKDDDDMSKEAKMIGLGIVEVMELDEVFKDRKSYKDWYWIFDMNIYTDMAKTLNDEDFKVLGGQEISEKLENDRDFAKDLMEKYGIKSPPTHEFTSIEDGLKFLEENSEKAYVFKPDEPKGIVCTYVPDCEKSAQANKELSVYLSSIGDAGTYILQERIKGVEANFEVWFHKGKPFFAMCDIECKKKLNQDLGGMVGCSQDINFAIPLECKAIKSTIGKLYEYYKDLKYTGFVDANVIVYDNQNYYLETCNRFGYNSHPNIFLSISKVPTGELLASIIDGDIHDFYDKIRFGFGASATLYIDSPKQGLPIFIEDDMEDNFYMFDGYEEDGQLFMSGYSNEIGIVTAHGYTIKEAAEEMIEKAKGIRFPMRGMRSDLDRNDYHSSPQSRFDALDIMDYFDKI